MLMMDRLVCADDGNADPSSTHGKTVAEAKQLELDGWDYPKHLSGRVFGLVVHGDVAGIEGVRRSLADWLRWMGLIEAGAVSQLDRYIGYYEPYATSHRTLDADTAIQREVENVAAAVAQAVSLRRQGAMPFVGDALGHPDQSSRYAPTSIRLGCPAGTDGYAYSLRSRHTPHIRSSVCRRRIGSWLRRTDDAAAEAVSLESLRKIQRLVCTSVQYLPASLTNRRPPETISPCTRGRSRRSSMI